MNKIVKFCILILLIGTINAHSCWDRSSDDRCVYFNPNIITISSKKEDKPDWYENISNEKWEKILLKSNNSCFFDSPYWAEITEKTWNYKNATRLYYINGKEILIPMMEANMYGFKILTSMPGNFDCGGLFSESTVTIDEFKSIIKDILGGRNLVLNINLSNKFLSKSIEKWKINDEFNYTHKLNLNGKNFDEIWKNSFHKNTRTAIRKAKKSGIEIKEGTSLDDLKTFYNIYDKASQKRDNVDPVLPYKFFENLYKYGSNHVKLTLATKDDEIIAGLITLSYSKNIYEASNEFLREYSTYNAPSLLISESIRVATQEGYEHFDFGHSGKLTNLIKFKERFGAERVEINRYRINSNLSTILSGIMSKVKIKVY